MLTWHENCCVVKPFVPCKVQSDLQATVVSFKQVDNVMLY